MTDELEIYDACTADSLERNDIIQINAKFVQVILTYDNGITIEVSALDLEWEEEVDFTLEPDELLSLYKFKD